MIMLYSINLRIMGRPSISLLRAETITRSIAVLFAPLGSAAVLVFLAGIVLFIKLVLDFFFKTEGASPSARPGTTRR
jgi:putative ABC transport system permease protein